MVTVEDILALPPFTHTELAATCSQPGSRYVRNVVILTEEPARKSYDDFYPGDFVITTFSFASGDQQAIEDAVEALFACGIAALAVKDLGHFRMTERIRELVMRNGIPIYLFAGDYLEVIAYQGLDLLRRDRVQSDKRHLIDELIRDRNPGIVRDTLYHIAGITGKYICCMAFKSAKEGRRSVYALLSAVNDALIQYKRAFTIVDKARAFRYRDVLLGFVSFSSSTALTDQTLQDYLTEKISAIPDIYVGYSAICPLNEGDLTVRQALAALQTAIGEDEPVVKWNQLRENAFRAAVTANRLYKSVSSDQLKILREYDLLHSTELETTTFELARAFGDVRAVADKLSLHPNTVRYRMHKAKEALGMSDYPDNRFAFFLGLVFLEELNPFNSPNVLRLSS